MSGFTVILDFLIRNPFYVNLSGWEHYVYNIMYLYKNLSPFFNDIWLMLQVVLGGLTNVDLHALITEKDSDKQDILL